MYTGTGDGRWDPENGIYGNGIIGVKQDPKTKALMLDDYYGPSNAEWLVKRDLDMQVTPVDLQLQGQGTDGGRRQGVPRLPDGHRSRSAATIIARRSTARPLLCNEDVNFASAGIWGSLASWEDSKGTRWVLTPIWGPKHSQFKAPIEYGAVKDGAIVAFKVEEKNGKLQLTPAWISRDMNRAEPPVIANGVVFAYGNGEDTDQAYRRCRPGRRRRRGAFPVPPTRCCTRSTRRPARNCGRAATRSRRGITGAASRVANGRVYIGTFDSNSLLLRHQEVDAAHAQIAGCG